MMDIENFIKLFEYIEAHENSDVIEILEAIKEELCTIKNEMRYIQMLIENLKQEEICINEE